MSAKILKSVMVLWDLTLRFLCTLALCCLKLCSSPLRHHCSEGAGGMVGFPMDKDTLSSCLQR